LGGCFIVIGGSPDSHVFSHSRWTAFTGDWQNRHNIGPYSGYDMRSVGFIHASETQISPNHFGGTALAYDNVYQKFDTIQSACRMDIFRLAFYGGSRRGNFSSDSYIGYTRNWSKTQRHIDIPGDLAGTPDFNGIARSRFTNNMFGLGFESRQDLRFGCSRLTPSIGMHYIHLSRLRATETGAEEANLSVNAGHFDSVRFPMGAKLSHELWTGCIVWRPEVRAFYIREVADASVRARTSFNNVHEVPFFADSGKWGRNCGRFGTGLNVQMMDWLSFRIDYDYELYEWTSASEFGITLGVIW
jgi:outer membrane autotransporter protein